MNRNNFNKYFVRIVLGIAVCFTSVTIIACQDDIEGSVVTDPGYSMWDTTEIGKYIDSVFTKPYNIRVIYRWNDGYQDYSKYLVPVKEEKVKPFLEMLKRVWMDPYVEVTTNGGNPDFFPTYVPKEILVTGSRAINSDGTVTLGFAENARQILLYNVNNLTPKDTSDFVMFIHTMHHEFAHILQQTNKDYDGEYRAISKGGYTSSWMNISNKAARELGFITAYSQAEVDEDFVEILATRLINSDRGWKYLLNTIQNDDARRKIEKKESIVRNYMLSVWSIDIYQFRDMVHEAIRAEMGFMGDDDFVFDGNEVIANIINNEIVAAK